MNLLFTIFISQLVCHTLAASAATWTSTPFNPASIPLAVRSPYLSAWLNQGSGTALNADWPRFWTGSVCLFRELREQNLATDLPRLWDGQAMRMSMARHTTSSERLPFREQLARKPFKRVFP
jgi:hypothetical protein